MLEDEAHHTFRSQVSLENLNPNNVTKLNDVPLIDRCIVKDSDTFAIGDRTFRFEMAGGKVQCTDSFLHYVWLFDAYPHATAQKTPSRRASTKSVSSDVKMSGGSRPGDFTPKGMRIIINIPLLRLLAGTMSSPACLMFRRLVPILL